MAGKKPRKPRYADPGRARVGRALTLAGYFGLLGLILAWFTVVAPPETVPRVLPLAALAVPLLFPLRGLLHGRRYTHQWASFLALPYFLLGVDAWANAAAGRGWLGAAMVLGSLLLFAGTVLYARYTPSGGPSEAARAELEAERALAEARDAEPDRERAVRPDAATTRSRS